VGHREPYCGYLDQDHTTPTNALLGAGGGKLIGFKTKYFWLRRRGKCLACSRSLRAGRSCTALSLILPLKTRFLEFTRMVVFDGEAWGIQSPGTPRAASTCSAATWSPPPGRGLYNFILDRGRVGAFPPTSNGFGFARNPQLTDAPLGQFPIGMTKAHAIVSAEVGP